jgi:nitrite reductase/ring-hydroxylating ferredoxin subunit
MTDTTLTKWFEFPGAPAPGTYLCTLADIPDGGVKMLSFESKLNEEQPTNRTTALGILLLRSGTSLRAYLNHCAHFGVALSKTQTHLIYTPHVSISCNIHYARYRWDDGYCEQGDCAGKSLVPVPLAVGEDGRIFITC